MWCVMIGAPVLVHLKRNVYASMLGQKQAVFSFKQESRIESTHSGMVDIHHYVLKSTTSAGAVHDLRDMRKRRDSKF